MNQITKLNIEARTRELKIQGGSERSIASILSKEVKQKISPASVHRYFANNAQVTQNLIEKKETLQTKIVEMEIDTLCKRTKILERLDRLADKAEHDGIDKTVLEALKIQLSVLDSIDKRLGRFTPQKVEHSEDTEITITQILKTIKKEEQKEKETELKRTQIL